MRELENYYLDLAVFFGWLIVARFLLGALALVFHLHKLSSSLLVIRWGNGLRVSQLQAPNTLPREDIQGHFALRDLSLLCFMINIVYFTNNDHVSFPGKKLAAGRYPVLFMRLVCFQLIYAYALYILK